MPVLVAIVRVVVLVICVLVALIWRSPGLPSWFQIYPDRVGETLCVVVGLAAMAVYLRRGTATRIHREEPAAPPARRPSMLSRRRTNHIERPALLAYGGGLWRAR